MSRVLIACEQSQLVCLAFRELGFEAYSCDLEDCEGGYPEWHIKGDAIEAANSQHWDMMIAHPPCTHLAVSGAKHFEQKRKDGRQQFGIDLFLALTNAPIDRIVVENPMGIMSTIFRKPDQIIHPYHFGEPFQKTTCLWLKNVPKLIATHFDAPLFGETVDKGEFYEFTSKDGKKKKQPMWFAKAFLTKDNSGRAKARSFRYPLVAKAMADQWSKVL